MKKFNEYINEGNLMIYRGADYPYNYIAIKGDDLYSVSFKKGKPFLHKYHGKINPKVYNPVGELIKNPSKGLIFNVQKLDGKANESVNEEFEERKDIAEPDRISFMSQLEKKVEEFLKDYPDKFKINIIPGKVFTIASETESDLRVDIKLKGDMIHFSATPTEGPEYEFSFNYNKGLVDSIFGLVKSAFIKDPHSGSIGKPGETYKPDTTEPSIDVKEEEIEPLDVPITTKPKRRTRSININVIQDVLEDAFILDDIDLKDTDVTELIRRMLLESRRRTNARRKK